MNRKLDELTKRIAQSAKRRDALNRSLGSVYLIVVLMAFGLLASHAQPIQPEILFNFPHGNLPHQPENPYGNLVEGIDGSFYGTSVGGGNYHRGTVFKVTTNGLITLVASFNNTNGATPFAGLAVGSDGNFYGTTSQGGGSGAGTVFKVTADGALTTLVSFNGTNGSNPQAALTPGPDGNFYGTTATGGNGQAGTVFKVTTNGALTTLVSFRYPAGPQGALTVGPDGDFYGTTPSGGDNGVGTVFKVTPDGTLTTLASFGTTNGASPYAALTLGNDGNFYGTTVGGGNSDGGTVFRVTTNGTLTRIAAFSFANGAFPMTPLLLAKDGNFYGTTFGGGGTSAYGTVFRVTPNGGLSRLVSFTGANGNEPHAGLTLGSDGNLYGTTAGGGVGGNGFGVGTVFRLTTGGTFTKLASFGNADGINPSAPLTLGTDGNFYGTTSGGGLNGRGMVFKVTTDGVLTDLASFGDGTGTYPAAALTLGNDGNFYGTTTSGGGSSGAGTVFRVTTNSTLTRLVSFNISNGAFPQSALILGNDGIFYGTTPLGGTRDLGTVFKVTTNGLLTRLVSFNNTNGASPLGPLALDTDGNLYGTTSLGGSGGAGTVFKVTTNGTLTTLVSFSTNDAQHPQGGLTRGNDGNFYGLTGPGVFQGPGFDRVGNLFRITSEGALTKLGSFSYADPGNFRPSTLTLAPDGHFYGTTAGGSSVYPGTVFQVTSNGAFATLVSFAYTNAGFPIGPLTVGPDGNFYGTTSGGGSEQFGTIFRLSPRAPVVFGQPQPASQIVRGGVDVTIGANIFGAPPLNFQWVFNDQNLPGETNASLILKHVTPSMSGNYFLRATNRFGNTSSSNALLTVLPALIANLPVTGVTATGAVLNGSVTLGPDATVAWFEWGTNTNYGQIAGLTNMPGGSRTVRISGVLSGLDASPTYHYHIAVSNSFGIAYGPDHSFRAGLITYAQNVLDDHPIAYWRLNEPDGAPLAYDIVGGHNGAYRNISLGLPGYNQFDEDTAAGFGPGINSFVGDIEGIDFSKAGTNGAFTLECWVKAGFLKPDEVALISKGPRYGAQQFDLDAILRPSEDGTLRWFYGWYVHDWTGATYYTELRPGMGPDNNWQHLVAVYDGAAQQLRLHVNAVQITTGSVSRNPLLSTPHSLAIGSRQSNPSGGPFDLAFNGTIDEVAIYDYALSTNQVLTHYLAGTTEGLSGDPLLLVQPSSRTNNFGTTATFSLVAGGTSPFQYQWLKNGLALADGTLIIGARAATLTVSNVSGAYQGAYSAVIRNSSGSVTSAVARLVVIDPLITSQPTNQAAELTGSATLSVVALGTPPLKYQWLKEGVPLAGATSASLALSNLQALDAGGYAAVVSNPFSAATSAVASVTVNLVTADPAFNSEADGTVYALAVQADGKLLLGGEFTTLGGQSRKYIGRLNSDSSVDAAFNPGADSIVYSLAVQPDEKILVGGYFSTLGGQPRNHIGRLNADGSLDTTFNPDADFIVYSLAVQANGKILVGGYFTTLGAQPRNGIARLNPDGSLDATFDPGKGGNSAYVDSLVVQGDGKIVVGGAFTMLAGQSCNGIGRLDADGSLDSAFGLGVGSTFPNIVDALAVQADGKILVGGRFTTLGGQRRYNIGRFNADGSLDTTFNPGAGYYPDITSLAVQADGKILVGGNFYTLAGQPRTNIARLNADGNADLSFNPGADYAVSSLAVQPSGQILAGGAFTTLGGQTRNKIGRLNNSSPATQNLTYDGSTLLWLRGGTGPEVWRTTFEVTTNSLDWSILGPGARVPGGWQLTGVTLPSSCTVRARGFANAGYRSSSSWFVEGYWGELVKVSEPSSRTNNAGTSASFSVVAGGTGPLRYQWYKDGVALADGGPVSGAQAATLTLNSVFKANEGAYSVEISHASGRITSAVARLTVIEPIITSQPTNQAAELNGNATLSVVGLGTPPVRYQWLKEGLPLANTTNSSLGFTNLQLVDAGSYAVVVSNQFGSVTSDVVVLTVNGTTTDPTFNPGADSTIYSLALQADGKLLAGGEFSTLGGQPRSHIGRFNADGRIDPSFDPGANAAIYYLAVQADGQVLLSGNFTTVGGHPRNYIARLNPDGSLDTVFNPGANGGINSLAIQADGKILVAGGFTMLGGQPRNYLGRLNGDGSLDAAFNPGANGGINSLAIQADGKILVAGGFTTLGGQPRTNIARLNPDGSLDTNFNPRLGVDYPNIRTFAVQADGKILVGGDFAMLDGQTPYSLGRLNADGSVDAAFNPGFIRVESGQYASVYSLAVQADGKILVGGVFTALGGQTNIARLNADGSLDLTFNPGADNYVNSLALQVDGNILVGGGFTRLGGQTRNYLGRLNNTGPATQNLTYDGSTLLWQRGGTGPEVGRTTFEVTTNSLDWTNLGAGARVPGGWQLTGVSLPNSSTVRARGFASGGSSSWFVEGYWGGLVFVSQPSSRTNNAGTSASFSVVAGGTEPVQYQWYKDGVPLSDGGGVSGAQAATLTLSRLLKSDEGAYTLVITNVSSRITSAVARLAVMDPVIVVQPANQVAELNGGATLSVDAAGTTLRYQWFKEGMPLAHATNSSLKFANLQLIDAGNYSVVVSNQFGRVTSDAAMLTVNGATTDPTFKPVPDSTSSPSLIDCLALQADGKILVGGNFDTLGGQPRKNIGRLNADGSLDAAFNAGADGEVLSLAVQTDGKILVGGAFLSLDGAYIFHIGRLNADGTRDIGFSPQAGGGVYSLVIQADGKILVGGGFGSLGGQPRNNIGRLNATGTLDTNFKPEANNGVICMAIQADGKILVGGYFNMLGGQPRNGLGRLNADGSLDTTFTAEAGGGIPFVECLALQADGKILVGGRFEVLGGQPRVGIGRVNADGSLDTAFDPGASAGSNSPDIVTMAVQADGKILLGGYFTSLGGQPRTNIARLNDDGSIDPTFNPGTGPDSSVFSLAVQADGKILVGGWGGQGRSSIGRLNNTGLAMENFAYDGATLLWQRGGSGPEVWRTTFEVTTNTLDWTSLGAGARVPGGWQLTGLSLPAYCTVRARGFIAGDCYGVSGWFIERLWRPGPELEVGFGSAIVAVGGNACVPLYIDSRYGLTNLEIVVELPEGRLTNLNLVATAPEVGLATVQMMGATQALITLSAKPGFVLPGSAQIASVCFDASSAQDSSFVELDAGQVLGVRENGSVIEYAASRPGRAIVVGPSSLLECVLQTNGRPVLILYGQPGSGYAIEERADDGTWTTVLTTLSLTNFSLAVPAPASNGSAAFFRAKHQ